MPTPVWFGLDEDRFVVCTEARTAKVKRIRRNPRVEGTARILENDAERERAEGALDRHYGRTRRVYEGIMTRPSESR